MTFEKAENEMIGKVELNDKGKGLYKAAKDGYIRAAKVKFPSPYVFVTLEKLENVGVVSAVIVSTPAVDVTV